MERISQSIVAIIDRFDAAWLLPLMLIVLIHYFAEPARWRLYLGNRLPTGSYQTLFQIFSLTAMVGYMLPAKLGLPLRIVLLRRQFDLALTNTVALLALDGSLYYAAWAVAALLGIPWLVGLGWTEQKALLSAGALLILAVVIGAAIRRYPQIVPDSLRLKLNALMTRFKVGLDTIAHATSRRVILASLAITGADITSHVVRHGVLLAMFGHALEWQALFATSTVSIFCGLISLMPMGLGGYDLAIVLLLTQQGIPAADAVAVAVTNRLANIAVGTVLGMAGGTRLGLNAFNRRALVKLTSQQTVNSGKQNSA